MNLPIQDLPEYLKNLKNNKSFGDGLVVDMGNIQQPFFSRSKQIIFATTLALAVGTGILTYNLTNKNITLVINSTASSQNVQNIITEYGAEIVSIENQNNAYKVRLKVRNLGSFIEKLRDNKEIKNVELK